MTTLLAVLAAAALHLALPNDKITPGLTVPRITLTTVCATAWGKDVRHVTIGMKKTVFASYHIRWEDRARYEVDHRISRDIGGADGDAQNVSNLWPQPLYEAKHFKDPLEIRLNKLACNGTISLKEAQDALRGDWTKAYVKFVGPFPSPGARAIERWRR